ncbi:MAG: hypothetical protein AUH85_04170 [Chloroflexi bacterium 13_1_40CM_4_68_4]|nr:MAG: hypothetical protein AUH85_04170 [Chloroflexi bacterium 13_1_40CM_4_68_4]
MASSRSVLSVPRLGDPATLDAGVFGSKSASLARLRASFRVPDGFCLAATVFDELAGAIAHDGAAERKRLRTIVARAYRELGAPLVAVRSSAIGEDGADTSFAGQHETVLGVLGVDSVVDAILACWRSASSVRASAYRRERGIATAPRVAVLVQRMVDAEISAIAFSADPVSADENVIVIDAAPGPGERIASGEVTPERYVIRKSDLAIVARAEECSLADAQTLVIAKLVRALEEAHGLPVDVECAFAGGELHLLQCRPITTLRRRDQTFPVAWRDPRDAMLHWEREDAHYSLVIPPLSLEYVRCGPAFGLRRRSELMRMPFFARFEPFNGQIYAALEWTAADHEREARNRDAVTQRRALARDLPRLWTDDYLPRLRAHYAWMRSIDAEHVDLAKLAGAWEELWSRVNDVWVMHMMTTGGSYILMDELVSTYIELTGGSEADAFALTAGRAVTLQQLERELYELTESTRRWDEAGGIASGSARDLDAARRLRGGPRIVAEIERFLETHGDVGQSGEDLRRPAWRDEPANLIAEIARRLGARPEHPDLRLKRLLDESDRVAAQARDALRDRPQVLARFEEVLALAREAGPLTEEHNYWIDRIVQAHVRRATLAVGRRMTNERLLAAADDIFYFYVPEIAAALRERRDLRPRTAERVAELARWSRMRAPDWIGAPPPPEVAGGPTAARVDLGYKVAQDDPHLLHGVPASGGLGRGPARLVLTMDDFAKMRPGDVLVCRSTNVSWIPLFTVAAAVVTEVGGALSHAAVVAREFGVPAVVATGTALSLLADDQLVEVDGSAGTVRVLDPAPGSARPESAAHAAAAVKSAKSAVVPPPPANATPTLTDASIPPK